MKRILREPLVHFLLIGGVLFALSELSKSAPREAGDREIVVTAGRIEQLATVFARTWQRPPTETELKGLVDDFVAEEVFYREAKAMGLDQDDTIVRHRLRQKLEFVASDLALATEPTDTELATFLAAHPDEFAQPARYTFRQVYFNPDQHGDRLSAELAALQDRLKPDTHGDELTELGDRLMLPHEFTLETHGAVAAQFGAGFAAQLDRLPTGQWTDPVPSDHGVHLVLITERREGRMPGLDEIRSRVRTRVLNARQEEGRRRFLEELLAKYQVTIEWPAENSDGASEELTAPATR